MMKTTNSDIARHDQQIHHKTDPSYTGLLTQHEISTLSREMHNQAYDIHVISCSNRTIHWADQTSIVFWENNYALFAQLIVLRKEKL